MAGPIPPFNGGTGVPNANTLSWTGGNIAITVPGNVSYTLPASGASFVTELSSPTFHAVTIRDTTDANLFLVRNTTGDFARLFFKSDSSLEYTLGTRNDGGNMSFYLQDELNSRAAWTYFPDSPGATTFDSGLTVTNNIETQGDLYISSLGRTLHVAAGSDSCLSTATLSGGTVTVSNFNVQAGDFIIVWCLAPSGTQGILSCDPGNISPGTSFVINSSSVLDNSTVGYFIVRPF